MKSGGLQDYCPVFEQIGFLSARRTTAMRQVKTYLSKTESVQPKWPGPAIVKCWHIERNPASHGMRVDRSSSVEMSVKHLYSTIGRSAELPPAVVDEGDLEAITALVATSGGRPDRDRGGR